MAVDELDNTIEIQFFDGTVDEADPERWQAMRPERAGAPEDWSGSVDINSEDLPYLRIPLRQNWQAQLDTQEYLDWSDELDEPISAVNPETAQRFSDL